MNFVPTYDLAFIHALDPPVISKASAYRDNRLVKVKDGGILRAGYLEVLRCMGRREYAEYVLSAGPETARVLGLPVNGEMEALVLQEGLRNAPAKLLAMYREYDIPEGLPHLSRTRRCFHFADGPTLWAVDYDPHGDVVLSFEELLEAYMTAIPELRGQFCLQFPSSSSHIRRKSTGEILISDAGKRTIFGIGRGTDILRLTEKLYKRLWLAGYGFCKISKKGSLLQRTLIDLNMAQPERLDYIGGIQCQGDIEQIRPGYLLINEHVPDIDPDIIPDLTIEEERRYNELVAAEKANPKYIPLIAEAKRKDTEEYAEKLNARGIDLTSKDLSAYEHYRESRLKTGVVSRDETIITEIGEVSVLEILSNPSRYHGCACADPDDGELLGKAKIFLDRQPCIFSFSHGEHSQLLDPDLVDELRREKRSLISRQIKERLNKSSRSEGLPKPALFACDSALSVEILAENCKKVPFPVPPEIPSRSTANLTLAEAEEKVRHFLQTAQGDRLLRVEAGVGKTRELIKQAEIESAQELTIVAMQSHKLKKTAVASIPGECQMVIDVYGRTTNKPTDHGTPKLCFNAGNAKRYEQMGYQLGRTLCVRCEYKDRCRYHEQVEMLKRFKDAKKGLIFCSHQIAVHLIDDLAVKNVYFDESPLSSLIRPEPFVTIDDVQTLLPYMTDNGREVMKRLRQLCDNLLAYMRGSKLENARFYTTESTINLWRWNHTLWDAIGIRKSDAHTALIETLDDLEGSHQSQLRLFEAGVNRNAILWVRDVIGDGYTWLDFDLRQRHPVTLKRLVKDRLPGDCKITIADATIDLDEARSLFERDFQVCDARVPWECETIWVRQGMGVTKTKGMTDKQRAGAMATAIEYLPENCHKPLLATYKHHEKACLELARELRPGLNWLSGHFGDFRSSNKYEDCDSIILLGSLVLPPLGLIDTASILFPNDLDKQQMWWHHKSLEEQYQTVHRLRLVRNPGKTVIVVSRSYASHLLGPPDETVEIKSGNRKRGAALLRALDVIDLTGNFTKEDAMRSGIGHTRDEKFIAEIYHGDDGLILFDGSNTHWWPDLLKDICARRPNVELIGARNMGRGLGRKSAYVSSTKI